MLYSSFPGYPRPLLTFFFIQFYNDFRFKSRIKLIRHNDTIQQVRSSSNTMMIGYSSAPGFHGFKVRYNAVAPARTFLQPSDIGTGYSSRKLNCIFLTVLNILACGGIIRDVKGNLSAPTAPPFNESSYFCSWSMEAPESMTNNENSTEVTLSLKVTGNVGGTARYSFSRFCYNYQYISLSGKGKAHESLKRESAMLTRGILILRHYTALRKLHGADVPEEFETRQRINGK